MLERIIYNRFYFFFSENNILYKKQFGFQKEHSTDHVIVYLETQREFSMLGFHRS